MGRKASLLERLMDIDASVPLGLAALGWCVVGALYGFQTAMTVLAWTMIGVIAIGLCLIALAADQAEDTEFRDAAESRGGRLGGRWFGLGGREVQFEHDGVPVRVWQWAKGKGNDLMPRRVILTAEFSWPDPGFRCEVQPTGIGNWLGKLVGIQDIQIGSPGFDAAFVIKGDNPDRIRRFLTAELQGAIRGLPEQNELLFRIDGDGLRVQCERPGALEEFIEAALAVYDAANEAVGA